MAAKQTPKVHPGLALDQMRAFYDSVAFLLATAYNATSFMDRAEAGEMDPTRVIKAVNPSLKEAVAKCRAWTETEQ